MIPVPSGVRVWLAVGRTDMRRGMNGLALQVQEALRRDPHAGDLYVTEANFRAEGESGVPSRSVLGFGDASPGCSDAIRSCSEVNDLIVRLFGEALPTVDLSHDDLARRHQRPEQHGGCFGAGQHGLRLDPSS